MSSSAKTGVANGLSGPAARFRPDGLAPSSSVKSAADPTTSTSTSRNDSSRSRPSPSAVSPRLSKSPLRLNARNEDSPRRSLGRGPDARGGGMRTDPSSSRIGLTSLCPFEDGVQRQRPLVTCLEAARRRTCLQEVGGWAKPRRRVRFPSASVVFRARVLCPGCAGYSKEIEERCARRRAREARKAGFKAGDRLVPSLFPRGHPHRRIREPIDSRHVSNRHQARPARG